MDLKGKTFIVTGAGSGMGREITLALLKKGARVAGCDVNEKGLHETAELANDPDTLKTWVLDVTDAEKTAAFPARVKADFGALHGVVNNAGIIQRFVPVSDLNDREIRRLMEVNFFGALGLTRAALPILLEAEEAAVVNVSSMGGFLPVPGQGMYGASKAAVKLFTEALRGELRGTRVRVGVVFPGAVATNIASGMFDGKGADMLKNSPVRMTAPDKAAQIIVRGIEKGKARIFVGRDAKMMDILYRIMPVKAVDVMAKRINAMTGKQKVYQT